MSETWLLIECTCEHPGPWHDRLGCVGDNCQCAARFVVRDHCAWATSRTYRLWYARARHLNRLRRYEDAGNERKAAQARRKVMLTQFRLGLPMCRGLHR